MTHKIKVYIATTKGPIAVQRLSAETAGLRNVICVDGTARSLPISRDYDAFVKDPTGVVERATGHGSYRLDLTGGIDCGQSWQLAALCAHGLKQQDRLCENEEQPHAVLWLTGQVDRDLNVRPVGHILDKLEQSRNLFDQLNVQNIPTFCYIPAGCDEIPSEETLLNLGIDGRMISFESLHEYRRLATRFDLDDPYPQAQQEIDAIPPDGDLPPAPDDPAPLNDNRFLRYGVIGLCGIALFGGLYLQFADTLLSLRENSLRLSIKELRAHPDQGCTHPNIIPLTQDGNAFPNSDLSGLCALEISVENLGAPAHLWVYVQDLKNGHFLLADREGLLNSQARQGVMGWRMTIPKHLNKSMDYRIVALAANKPLSDSVNRLLRRQTEELNNWEAIRAYFTEEGISSISALHSLEVSP